MCEQCGDETRKKYAALIVCVFVLHFSVGLKLSLVVALYNLCSIVYIMSSIPLAQVLYVQVIVYLLSCVHSSGGAQ